MLIAIIEYSLFLTFLYLIQTNFNTQFLLKNKAKSSVKIKIEDTFL
nr:MAG TPA: hypothetical protein [Caudoviricetes sp.]